MSVGSKSSVSPAESRVLSEQSEKTLDSDSKLSNSFHSKLLPSPPNSSFKNGESTEVSSSSARKVEGNGSINDLGNETSRNEAAELGSVPKKKRPDTAPQDIFAEQDMFSEHFDVSF